MTATHDGISLTDGRTSAWTGNELDTFGEDIESIATECGSATSDAQSWTESIDALLGVLLDMWGQYGRGNDGSIVDDEFTPTCDTIQAAIAWLAFLRRHVVPSLPPTCIIPEPGGGLIVEHRDQQRRCVWELSLYNEGTAEFTVYQNGKVKDIIEVRMFPPSVRN
jgi:hypothetical protein